MLGRRIRNPKRVQHFLIALRLRAGWPALLSILALPASAPATSATTAATANRRANSANHLMQAPREGHFRTSRMEKTFRIEVDLDKIVDWPAGMRLARAKEQ